MRKRNKYPAAAVLTFAVIAFAMITMVMAVFASWGHARDVTLRWDLKPEGVAGFSIHYDTDSGGSPYGGMGADQGPSPVRFLVGGTSLTMTPELKGRTTWEASITGLMDRETWFVVTANDGVYESAFSNEISAMGVDHDPRKTQVVGGVCVFPTGGE